MARAKQASKQKRRRTALPAWGAAGMSLAMAGGASAAVAPTANAPSHSMVPPPVITLGEEEISDVSLATFYVFDKESRGTPGQQLAQRGCGRCGGGCRAGGCGGRCGGGCRGCGCRCAGGCGCSCAGCAIGGCTCCLSWGACQLC
jgi:hypothetical protein